MNDSDKTDAYLICFMLLAGWTVAAGFIGSVLTPNPTYYYNEPYHENLYLLQHEDVKLVSMLRNDHEALETYLDCLKRTDWDKELCEKLNP